MRSHRVTRSIARAARQPRVDARALLLLSCTATAGLAFGPRAAQATPPLPTAPTGAMHVGKQALDLIGTMALEKVPAHVDFPTLQRVLFNCPGDPMALFVTQAFVDVAPHSLTFQPVAGALRIDGLLDISGFAHVEIQEGYACVGTAACDVTFSATGLAPSAEVSLSISNGAPQVSLGEVGATVPPGGLHVQFNNCLLENLSPGVVDSVAARLLEIAQQPIGNKLREVVPPLLEARLGSMLGVADTYKGYGFNAAVSRIDMTPEGIDAYAAISVSYDGAAAVCIPPASTTETPTPRNPTATTDELALPVGPTSSVVIGISADLLSSALGAAWRSGIMCMDDSLIGQLGFDPDKLAALVPGMPPGMSMHFAMGLEHPPTVETDAKGAIKMRVHGAELLISMVAPGQSPAGVAVATDFSVGVRPSVDLASGTIYAELTDLAMERMEMRVGASGADYSIDPERLSVLMRDIVLPLAAQRLRTMPLSPAAFGTGGLYAWLTQVSAHDRGVYVELEAWRDRPGALDTALPVTTLEKTPGHLVRAGMARYQVAGKDDLTPPQLVRYQWQLDDGAISAPSFARVILAPVVQPGAHRFRVRAVDLANKIADGWQEHHFELDPVAPQLTITERPAVALRETSARIVLAGTDDRSAPNLLSYAYRVEERVPGGELVPTRSVEATGLDGGSATIVLDDIVPGNTYEVTVLLYDEAGNVTSEKVGFGAAAPGGCSVAADTSANRLSSLFSLLLLAVAIRLASRRRPAVSR